MRRFLLIIFCLISVNNFGQVLENNSYNYKYYYKNHELYGSDSSLYSGEFEEYYPGLTKERGNYLNGLKDGTFYKYQDNGSALSVENYSMGLKNGEFRNYYPNDSWFTNLISLEYYKNDTLKDSYYWNKSGQLIKTIINKQTKTYAVDSSIWKIISFIKGEKMVENPYAGYTSSPYGRIIRKKYLCKKDPIIIQVAKITCADCRGSYYNEGDTIVLNDFKVLSFRFTFSIAGDSPTSEVIIGNVIPEKYKTLCKTLPVFYLEDIVILDNNNVQYNLSSTKYKIID
jgi:hypothetical protein